MQKNTVGARPEKHPGAHLVVDELGKLGKKPKKKWSKDAIKKQVMAQSMALPGVIMMIVFTIFPIYGIYVAFSRFSMFHPVLSAEFVGLHFFRMAFNHPMFMPALINTVGMNVIRILIAFPLTIIVAIMVNELTNMRFKKIMQTVSYLPFFISWIVIGGMMIEWMGSLGLFNNVLMGIGLISEPIGFLTTPEYYWAVAIISDIWRNLGWGTILYLAAMTSIDPTLYEAAKIDGARKLQQIRHITIPGMRHIIAINLVLTVAGLLGSNLDQTLILQNPRNFVRSDVLGSFVFRTGIGQGNFSIAAAIGLVISLVSFVLVIVTNIASKKIGDADIF